MSVVENVALAKRWFDEVWNQGSEDTVHELLAADAIGVGLKGSDSSIKGPDGFLPFMRQIRSAFPGMRMNVDDAFGSGNKVVLRWTADMTHAGDHLGFPATNRNVRVSGIAILEIKKRQIVRGWDAWDQAGMLAQLGVIPPAMTTAA